MKRAWLLLLVPAAFPQTAPPDADSARGAELFRSLSCIACHSIGGGGGRSAPDLGRIADRGFTPAALAATMWNHAPAMWNAMTARGLQPEGLDEPGAADLFAYFYSARFFENPGDAARGKRVFEARGCARCHGLDREAQAGVRPVSQWANLNRPFALTEEMWNHMPRMLAAAVGKRAAWPNLSGQDLSDLLVYLRNLPDSRQMPAGAVFTAGAGGAALFQQKGCAGCHAQSSALAVRIKGGTLTAIAAQMWNHGPAMAAAGATPAQFQAGEMQELLSYLWGRQFLQDAGDAAQGAKAFKDRRCVECHGSGAAPQLIAAGRAYSGPAMIAALWRHGPSMLEQMKSRGIAWPRLDAADMAGLIAYLNRTKPDKP